MGVGGDAIQPSAASVGWRRPAAVLGAALAALLVWSAARLALGGGVHAPALAPNQPARPVGPSLVLTTAVVAGAAGWALLAVLERASARPRRLWTVLATFGLAASLGAPLSGVGVAVGDRLALLALHLAVGAVLIPALATTVPARRGPVGPTAPAAAGDGGGAAAPSG